MKNIIYANILFVFLSSCDNVKVTNSSDDEAVPVRMIQEKETDESPTTHIQKYSNYKIVQNNVIQELENAVKKKWLKIGNL